ncbi:hypothetical protein H6P81_004826 [Aristolochia fimbriata]|uniref:Isopenicillin N synthase-like Fe(2+) 2OG dioxygenase domain-containing protein n=1 Tax=Aristolochia fimbriata TaxID=158543 RepID=A0AAV7EWB4_ARIFI|nr:hypothetical protein H6P81_004826 [Aristolochia fimbriata]
MEAEAEILRPFELRFSDLLLLSSSSSSISLAEVERLENVTRSVLENLGPEGPGLLSITGVPDASVLRGRLLPLARRLALLSYEDCRRVLKDHKLGTDVSLKNVDRTVSSFALQLKYVQEPSQECVSSDSSETGRNDCLDGDEDRSGESLRDEFRNLRNMFEELGFCMMELGLRLAQLCDKAIGGHELEQSILESCTAKGRLIHYHSSFDSHIQKESKRAKGRKRGSTMRSLYPLRDCFPMEEVNLEEKVTEKNGTCKTSMSHLWQQWHYDYGIFTVLTTPLFTSIKDIDGVYHSVEQEVDLLDGHCYLQVFDPSKNKILMVQPSPGSFIVQVGESADILSKGKLRATLHSVCKPLERVNLSRKTFVVFLQPAWGKVFSTDFPNAPELLTLTGRSDNNEESDPTLYQTRNNLIEQIHRVVPPLSSRLKDGMTFAEFSQQTTKQYYGGSGFQSVK